ncbi:MAG: cyclase family protein, partial [Bacteroidia bacterium]|nr:cyclase family protein [Bacteroidia bacterium]
GVVLDFSHKADNEIISAQEVQEALQKIEVTLQPGMIVLVRTDNDRFMGQRDFPDRGTGMSAQATEWLIDQGIKVMGIDQWGWDLPLRYQVKRAKETNDNKVFWEGHLVGQRKEYCHMEQLTNLKALPNSGFKVAVFPLKIVGASAAPARVVAIIEK